MYADKIRKSLESEPTFIKSERYMLDLLYKCSTKSHDLQKEIVKESIFQLFPEVLQDMDDPHHIEFEKTIEKIKNQLPKLIHEVSTEQSSHLVLKLIAPFRRGNFKFFFDFVTCHLMQESQLPCSSYLAIDFYFLNDPQKIYTLLWLSLKVPNEELLQAVTQQVKIFKDKICMGIMLPQLRPSLLSQFSNQTESSRLDQLHEKLYDWMLRHPKRIRSDIFSWMAKIETSGQTGIIDRLCFCDIRRLILTLQRFHSNTDSDKYPSQSRAWLVHNQNKLNSYRAAVLCTLDKISLPSGLPQDHLCRSLRLLLGHNIERIESSYLHLTSNHFRTHHFFIEIIINGPQYPFTYYKTRIKNRLPNLFKNSLLSTNFNIIMPRNDEETLRFILELCEQIQQADDIPHIHIQFDNITESSINYTVIIVSPQKNHSPHPLVKTTNNQLCTVLLESSKDMGPIEEKRKMSWVYRFNLAKDPFCRADQSIDLFRARQYLSDFLKKPLGYYRDFSGGIISKQMDVLKNVYKIANMPDWQSDYFLDNFFFHIEPSIMIPILDAPTLAQAWALIKTVMDNENNKPQLLITEFGPDLIVVSTSPCLLSINNFKQQINMFEFPEATVAQSQFNAFDLYYYVFIARNLSTDLLQTLKLNWQTQCQFETKYVQHPQGSLSCH